MTAALRIGSLPANHGRMAVAVLACLCLGACVGGSAGGASAPARGAAQSGAQSVTVDGQSFAAAVLPGAAGKRLSAAGALPVQGQSVRVTRAGGALRMDEGAIAKKAARAACAASGGRFADLALGSYDRAGAWVFAGACA